MIDPKIGLTRLSEFTVYDGMVIVQIIEKMLRAGQVAGREVGHIATLRMKTVSAIRTATGIDLDSPPEKTPANEGAE